MIDMTVIEQCLFEGGESALLSNVNRIEEDEFVEDADDGCNTDDEMTEFF